MAQTSISKGNRPRKKHGFSSLKALARPDEWALDMGLMVDGRHFTLQGGEYVRDVIRDLSPEIVIPKAAQMRFTVLCIVKSLHCVVVRRWNGLYLMPMKEGSRTFVQSRIDPIIESNPDLDAQFSSVDNVLHKQTVGKQNLYVRGTNIARELQEVPVDFEVWDERDRMVEDNLEDARHRMDGSNVKKLIQVSTPTVDGHGIYSEDVWDASDQHRWEVSCPGCKRFQSFNWNDKSLDYNNLKLGDTEFDCALECAYCHRVIKDSERTGLNATGRWVPHNPDGNIRGYYINQFNSPTQPLNEIMKGWFKGQREVRKLKAFWQQNMGLPYAAPGDRITVELLDKCRVRGYTLGGIPSSYLQIGIDIGTHIHVWAWMVHGGKKFLWQLKLFREWGELDRWLASLPTWVGIVDAHPEKRAARDLCLKYHGRLFMGFEQDRDQQGEIATFDKPQYGTAPEVKIDRTLAFDTVIADFMSGQNILPMDARDLGEQLPRKDYNGVYHHMIQQVRVEEENTKGILIARWRKNKNPDHWHHACMFATVASLKTPPLIIPSGISAALNMNVISSA